MRGGVLSPLASDPTRKRTAGASWYSICGFLVRSEVPLPFPRLVKEGRHPATWNVTWGDVRQRAAQPTVVWPDEAWADTDRSPPDAASFRWLRDADGTWLWVAGVATVHVSRDVRYIRVFPDADTDERVVGLLLGGPVTTFVMRELGQVLLHASAVTTSRGAIAFLGPKGRGKSTMAAAFLMRGAALLTDDILLLQVRDDGVYGVPGPPVMKVWDATAENTLGLLPDSLPSLAPTVDKKLLSLDGRYDTAIEPARLVALYLLDRYDMTDGSASADPSISSLQLRGAQALGVVLAHAQGSVISLATAQGYMPTLVRLVNQAPVRLLRYPNGFVDQAAACHHVLTEIDSG